MSVSAVTDTQSATSQTATTVVNPSSTLNQSDFLNLLVNQLENQDPLDPESSSDFASEMAQFSSLTQMQNLNTGFNQLYGVNLLGLTVQATDPTTNTNYQRGGDWHQHPGQYCLPHGERVVDSRIVGHQRL